MPRDMQETAKVLQSMLRENTGIAMRDSGGSYGRHWQRNQDRSFENEPESVVEFNTWGDNTLEALVSHNVYHWLLGKVIYNPELDAIMQEVLEEPDASNRWYSEDIELWAKRVSDKLDVPVKEVYSENSYNGESLLSQVIQYSVFEVDDQLVVALQIHGGADVRGGYTAPRIFNIGYEYDLAMDSDGTLYCNNPDCRANWFTDDGYHWYYDGSSAESEYQLDNLIPVKLEDIDYTYPETYREFVIKRFGVSFYNEQVKTLNTFKRFANSALTLPHRWVRRGINWTGEKNYKGSKTLIIHKLGKRFNTFWRYPVKHPTLLKLLGKVDHILPLWKLEYSKFAIAIENDSATCPVCNKSHLSSGF